MKNPLSVQGEEEKDIDQKNKKKKKMIIAIVIIAVIAAALIVFFLFFYKKTDKSSGQTGQRPDQQAADSRVTATGTTTVGMTMDELDLDNLDTKLYVEEVYLSDGDSVKKDDNVLKISDDSFNSAKTELERAQKQADYAYREAVVTVAGEKIDAKSTYDQAAVKQKYAQQTYDATVKEVTDKIDDIQDQIDDENDNIDEYTKAVNDNYYYKYYDIANRKKELDDVFSLQMRLYDEWGIEALTNTSDKVSSTTTSGQNGQNGQSTQQVNVPASICGKAGFLQGYITGYAAGEKGGSDDGSTSAASWWSSNYGTDPGDDTNSKYAALLDELGISYDSSFASGWWAAVSVSAQSGAINSYKSSYADGMKSGQQAAATNQKAALSSTQAAATAGTSNSQEYVTVYKLLQAEVEQLSTDYDEALKNYKEKTALAPTNLAKSQANLKKLTAQLAEQNTTLETTKADAKAVYDQTLAECSIAKETYDTAVKKSDEELTSLSNKKDDADDDMDYFNKTLSDGYVHASKSGTIMKMNVDSGTYISGDEMIMAYTADDSLAVSVSVDQADIAQISLGESAQITIDDHGDYTGTVTAINPVSSSSSKSSVTYTVTVAIDGDTSDLSRNLTASVTFGDSTSGTVSGNSSSESTDADKEITTAAGTDSTSEAGTESKAAAGTENAADTDKETSAAKSEATQSKDASDKSKSVDTENTKAK